MRARFCNTVDGIPSFFFWSFSTASCARSLMADSFSEPTGDSDDLRFRFGGGSQEWVGAASILERSRLGKGTADG